MGGSTLSQFIGRKKRTDGHVALIGAAFAILAIAASVVVIVPPNETTAETRPEMSVVTGRLENLSALFPRTAEYDFVAPEAGTYELPSLKQAPAGTLVDMRGEPVALGPLLKGRMSLVSFVYLLCSDTNGCPVALSTLFEVFDGSAMAPGLKDHLQLVTISFDPERDTPEALESFAFPVNSDPKADQKLDWHFLTSTGDDELKPVLDGFGQSIMRVADSDAINHLLRMYLVDEQGRIRNVYGLGMIDPRLLMSDVETLLLEAKGS